MSICSYREWLSLQSISGTLLRSLPNQAIVRCAGRTTLAYGMNARLFGVQKNSNISNIADRNLQAIEIYGIFRNYGE